MRTQHRGTRAGQHRSEHGEYGTRHSRRARSQGRPRWARLLPLVAFLAVGAVAVWTAVGFTGNGQTGVSFADSSKGQTAENTAGDSSAAPVSDSGSTVPDSTGGIDPGANPNPDNSGSTSGSSSSSGQRAGVTQTKYGPLTAADRDFLDKVWQAGSWEGPTGRQAQQRAASQKVKDVGLTLASDHAQLDAKVTAVAQQLGHTLPTKPSAAQQGWMNQLSQVEGEEYDRLFADLLRAAHGKVFAVVADIRAGTKNGLVRAFAQTANAAVLKHMTILEGTGFVNFSKLPDSKPPAASTPSTSGDKSAQPSSGQDNSGSNSGKSGSDQAQNQQKPQGQLPGSQDDAQSTDLTNTSSNTTGPGGGVNNYIIVIMLAVAGVISAVTYRQLHRRR